MTLILDRHCNMILQYVGIMLTNSFIQGHIIELLINKILHMGLLVRKEHKTIIWHAALTMENPFKTTPPVRHATDITRGVPLMVAVDTCTSAIHATEDIQCPNAIKQIKANKKSDLSIKNPTQVFNPNGQPLEPNKNHKLPTPIKTDRLEFYLEGYDPIKCSYLLNSLRYGFLLEHEGPRSLFTCNNLKSALSKPSLVQEKIEKEIAFGRVMGPYNYILLPDLRIPPPLGLVPKKHKGSWRLIHYLSYPDKKIDPLNSGISDESATVQFAGINEAIYEIKKLCNLNLQVFLAKTDIRSAFRILPVNPQDYNLLGFKWENSFYYDCCLPMGCRTSCKIFEEFSTALE